MDNDDAVRIEKELQEIKKNNSYLLKIIGNQTSIQDFTQSIIRNQDAGISKQIQYLKNQIQVISNKTDGEKGTIFTSIAAQINALMQNHRKSQETIIDLLTDVHQGHVSPAVITPEQLKQHLETASHTISSELQVPGENKAYHLAQIYSILEARIKLTTTHILLQIRIPLISRDIMNLYHLIPVPFNHQNTMQMITTQYKGMAVNKRQDKYYMLTIAEKKQCKSFTNDLIICKNQHGIYNTNNGEVKCEMAIFTHEAREIPPKCRLTPVTTPQVWAKLMATNQFIFAVKNKRMVNILCKEKTTTCSIAGVGLFSLTPQCTIITMIIVNPGINISSILPVSTIIRSKDELFNIPTYNISDDLKRLKNEIEEQQKSLSTPAEFKFHHIHHYVLIYFIIGCIIVIIIGMILMAMNKPKKIVNPQPEALSRTVKQEPAFTIKTESSDQNQSTTRPTPTDQKNFSIKCERKPEANQITFP